MEYTALTSGLIGAMIGALKQRAELGPGWFQQA
jgi:hypothetical protein